MVEFGVAAVAARCARRGACTRASGCRCLGRLVSPAWDEVGRFLGPSIEQLYAAEPALATLAGAGIGNSASARMSFGAGLVLWGARMASAPS